MNKKEGNRITHNNISYSDIPTISISIKQLKADFETQTVELNIQGHSLKECFQKLQQVKDLFNV